MPTILLTTVSILFSSIDICWMPSLCKELWGQQEVEKYIVLSYYPDNHKRVWEIKWAQICIINWQTVVSVQFSSVAQSCPALCDPMNSSTPGLPVHHQLPEFTQTHVHQVGDAIQPSHPVSSPSLPAPNPSQHHGLCQWVNSSHEVAKVLEFQLQHQSFQWTPRTGLL